MCANHSQDVTNYIRVGATYYTDNEAVEMFNWLLKDLPNYTDYEYDITDDYGQKIGVISAILSSILEGTTSA